MTDQTLTSNGSDAAPRPWRLFKAGERSELPHIADANGRVVARAEGNLWVWQDFIAPMIVAAVNAPETEATRVARSLRDSANGCLENDMVAYTPTALRAIADRIDGGNAQKA